jgi:hypothetical protein
VGFSLTDASVENHQCVLWGRGSAAVHDKNFFWYSVLSSMYIGALCKTLIRKCVMPVGAR